MSLHRKTQYVKVATSYRKAFLKQTAFLIHDLCRSSFWTKCSLKACNLSPVQNIMNSWEQQN